MIDWVELMMKELKQNKTLFIILFLALFLRFYKLSELPAGVHADEVRAGWNAISIAKTGMDDRGNKLALYYNTFGDFRPTGIIYLTILPVMVFGNNEFAIRFFPALLGALSVLSLYFLVSKIENKKIGLWAAFFMAVSPWHISVSRATSEVMVSAFIAIWGFYFFVRAVYSKENKYFLWSGIALAMSYFFYHSIRLLAPMFVFVLFIYFLKRIRGNGQIKKAFGVFIALGILTALMSTQSEARGRFKQVSIFNDLDVAYELSRMPFEEGPNKVFIARMYHNKPITYARRFVNEYAKYFSGDFFLTNVAKPGRYGTAGVGILSYVEILIFVCGLIAIAKGKGSYLPILMLLVAPIPAALTTEDAPNMHRAFYMALFIFVIEAYGVNFLLKLSRRPVFLKNIVVLSIFINLVFWWHMYSVHSKYKIASSRNYGAKELAIYLNELQDNYDKIILTNIPDELYPWIAYFNKLDPKEMNRSAILREKGVWEYKNLVFTGQRCPSRDAFFEPKVKRLLVVDAVGCASESKLKERSDVKILKEIKDPSGATVYTLWSKT